MYRLLIALILIALLTPAAPASAAVILASFEGKAAPPSTVHLAWTTDSEEGNAGFHIWRQTEPGNAAAIAFVASAAPPSGLGATYAFTDTVTPGLYTYWLVSEDAKGNLTAHDAIQVAVDGPTAVELASLSAAASAKLTCRKVKNACLCYIRNSRGVGLGWRARPALWCRLAGA